MLIPALDLIAGKIVRLQQGDYRRQTTYDQDPVSLACHYKEQGAEFLHLVDLDGARDPQQRQLALLKSIKQNSGLRTQAGGGVRTMRDVSDLLDAGIERVVIGSVAVREPDRAADWLFEFGSDALVIALDVRIDTEGNRWLATHGWQEQSLFRLENVLEKLRDAGCKHVLCTDISRDGMLNGPNTELYADLKARYPDLLWQASGGIAHLNDLANLKRVQCDSAILGKSLLTAQFSLQEALKCWQNA